MPNLYYIGTCELCGASYPCDKCLQGFSVNPQASVHRPPYPSTLKDTFKRLATPILKRLKLI